MHSFRKYFSMQIPPLRKVIRVDSITIANAVFQITYKGSGSVKNFERSIDVNLFKSSQVFDHLFCQAMLPALSGF